VKSLIILEPKVRLLENPILTSTAILVSPVIQRVPNK